MTSALDDAHEALLSAALRYFDAGAEQIPDIDGVSARLWYGMQVKLAAEAYGRERRIANRRPAGTSVT